MALSRNIGPKILELREAGHSYKQIVKILDCSLSTVAHHCNETSRKKAYQTKMFNHRKNTVILKEERGGACEICGFNQSLWALHFHHVVPGDKKFKLSDARGTRIENLR